MKLYLASLFICFIVIACNKEDGVTVDEKDQFPVELKIPEGFPVAEIPSDNQLTGNRIKLGRLLFYDPILSSDRSRSCASCHNAYLSFSDSTSISLGIEGRLGFRNTPSLANVVYQKALLREGGVPTLEMQILVPIQEHNEFDFNILEVADRMKKDSNFTRLSRLAYNREPDSYVITRSISAFERTFISGASDFDKWYSQGKAEAVTENVKRGYTLFQSDRLNCGACHSGFLFTNQGYFNNGLHQVYADSGRMRLTGLESDRALFKVPSLRNIALTAPYMHDGSLKDLDAVIDHYQSGGKLHPNQSPLIKPFVLSDEERNYLISFLRSLTDHEFVSNPEFRKL